MDNKPLKTLLVGVGGYGALYADYLLSGEFEKELCIAGVVDPYAKTSRNYKRLKDIAPIYDHMKDFFAEHSADLTIIATPIQFHYEQCMAALEGGSHVLCEKPIVPTLEALDRLQKAASDKGKLLTVGFQWCHSTVMQALKKRILTGEFGRPTSFKSYVSWPRDWEYYKRGIGWAGKIKSAEGEPIYDSIASNATAHYIQNMLYLLGPSMEKSASLRDVKAECYRANDIESFDTIAFRGKAREASVYYAASHATYYQINPVMDYAFEKARIWLNVTSQDAICYLHHQDGRVEDLGDGLGNGEKNRLHFMVKRLLEGEGEGAYVCTAETARPVTLFINELFENTQFNSFPEAFIIKDQQKKSSYVKNLHLDLWDCFNQNKLPSELALPWAE